MNYLHKIERHQTVGLEIVVSLYFVSFHLLCSKWALFFFLSVFFEALYFRSPSLVLVSLYAYRSGNLHLNNLKIYAK